jgi:SAM-dependent methyltransferase
MKDYIVANRAAYDALAEEYLERAGRSTEPVEVLAGKPLDYARRRFANIRALEIGPGSGEICAHFEGQKCTTTAIDVSAKILKNVTTLSPRTKTICADILDFDLGQACYELIYCGALIHLFTLEDAHTVMSRIYQALPKGGILFMNTTIHPESEEGYYEKMDYQQKLRRYRHRYTEPEFRSLLLETGLQIVDRITTDEHDRDKYWLALICKK